jgi:hypothetical protein
LVVSNMNLIFHFIYGIILPIYSYFQDGYCTTNQMFFFPYVGNNSPN